MSGHDASRRDALRNLAALLAVGTIPNGMNPPGRVAAGLDRFTSTPPSPPATGDDVSHARASSGDRAIERPYLDAALGAARWLEATARVEPDGATWYWDPAASSPEVQTNLYSGTAGITLFFLELHAVTRDERHRTRALRAADGLVARMPETVNPDETGLYAGLAGVAWTLDTVGRVARSPRHVQAAERAYERLDRAANAVGAGRAWNEVNDIIAGSAGIGLVLLDRERRTGDARALELAVSAGRRLLEVAIPIDGGLTWDVAPTVRQRYPNFSHGAGGVGYFLAQLHARTRERDFLEGAEGAARYLSAIATSTAQGGQRVYHHVPGGEQLYYLSWCHGPAGSARLYHVLGRITATDANRRIVDRLAQGTLDSRVPERSPGFWNNVSCCCGNCGVSDFYVAMAAERRDRQWLERAEVVARDTIERATADGDGLKWVQAENRVSPDDLRAQTGLMQGAAGVGLAMLRLDAALAGRRRVVVLPDDPWAA